MVAGLAKARPKKKKRKRTGLSGSRNPAKAVEYAPHNKMVRGNVNK